MSTVACERNHLARELDQLPLASTPEQLATWPGLAEVDSRLYSSLGDRLPSVAFSMYAFEWFKHQAQLEDIPIMQKQMLESTVVSPITGCWLPKEPERFRAAGGYIPQGDKAAAVSPSGSTTRHRATYQRYYVPLGEEPLTPEDDIDHICRNTACNCPWHLRRMGSAQNIELKNAAEDIETALLMRAQFAGRTGLVSPTTGEEWLDPLIEAADVGEPIDALIATRYGAYLLLRVNETMVCGKHVPCSIRDGLRKPAPYRPARERIEICKGQLSFDEGDLCYDLLIHAIARRQLQPLLAA